jgi:two-component system, sensor histidine kinase
MTPDLQNKLKDLNNYLREVAAGNDDITLEFTNEGEIGELEVLLSETIENLKAARESAREEKKRLELRVRKRTKELLQNRAAIMRMMRNAEKAREESDAANASKSEFLANMSHEIRTPMNGIIGAADMLKFTELSKDQNKFLGIISDSSKSLLNIINDILDLSKIEADKVELEQIPMDLFSIIAKTIEMLSITAEQKGLKIAKEISSCCPQFILGDPTRIGQILTNLISNAVKFTEQGTISINMSRRDDDHISFSIKDTGIGIARHKQEEIFGSFSQSDSSTTRKHGGTGLGLTITRKLINMMGGEIQVMSRINIGSTFSFYIKAPVAEKKKYSQNCSDESIQIEEVNTKTNKKLKVLVVEDHPVNMKIIRFMLSKKGCEIYEAENGKIAVEQFQKVAPDLIFMDMQMPVMSGLEAAREIRRLESELQLERTVITALTANAMTEDREKSREAGMDHFLSKPVTFEKLSAIIDRIPASDTIEITETEQTVLFDYQGLVDMFSGNKEIVNELLNEFLAGTVPFMNKLDTYVHVMDFSSIEKSAHTMKGQLLNLRADTGSSDFAHLEKAGREENKKATEDYYSKCKTSMAELKNVVEQLIAE